MNKLSNNKNAKTPTSAASVVGRSEANGFQQKRMVAESCSIEALRLFKSLNRGEMMAIILLTYNAVQIFALAITTEVYGKIQDMQQRSESIFFNIINYSLLHSLIGDVLDIEKNDMTLYVAYFAIALHAVLVLIVATRITLTVFFRQYNFPQFTAITDSIGSILYCFYIRILFIPFLDIFVYSLGNGFSNTNSNQSNSFWLSLINIVLSTVIALTFSSLEFAYEFIFKDNFARRDSQIFFLEIIVDGLMTIVHNTKYLETALVIHAIIYFFKLTIHIMTLPYYSHKVQQLYIQVILIKLLVALLIFIYFFTELHLQMDLLLLILSLITLGAKCGSMLYNSRLQNVPLLDCSTRNSFEKIDIYVRSLTQFCLLDEDQRKSYYSLAVNKYQCAAIHARHKKECKQSQSCFCTMLDNLNDNSSTSSQQNSFQLNNEQKAQEMFMMRYIMSIFQGYLANKSLKNRESIYLLYIYFTIQVLQVPQKAFCEIKMYRSQKGDYNNRQSLKGGGNAGTNGLKGLIILNQLTQMCADQFRSILENSPYQNQRLQIMMVAEFDEQLANYQLQLADNIIELHNLFVFLSKDFVNVQDLLDKNEVLLQKRKQLEELLSALFDVCPGSLALHQGAEVYLANLCNDNRSLASFIRQSHNLMFKNVKKQDIGIELFSPQSCAIFVSLIKPVGIVRKASKTVKNVFGFKRVELIDRTCTTIIPSALSLGHQQILENFVEYGGMTLIDSGAVNYYARNKAGFLTLVSKRIRINNTENDFGVCAHFVLPPQNNDNLLIKQDGYFDGITQNLYDFCFRRLFDDNISQISKLSSRGMIPYFGALCQEQQASFQDKTLLLLFPLNQLQMDIFQDNQQDFKVFLQNLMNQIDYKMGYLEIKADLDTCISQRRELKFYSLNIQSFKLIKRKLEKKELLKQLKQDINKILNINIEFQKIDQETSTQHTRHMQIRLSDQNAFQQYIQEEGNEESDDNDDEEEDDDENQLGDQMNADNMLSQLTGKVLKKIKKKQKKKKDNHAEIEVGQAPQPQQQQSVYEKSSLLNQIDVAEVKKDNQHSQLQIQSQSNSNLIDQNMQIKHPGNPEVPSELDIPNKRSQSTDILQQQNSNLAIQVRSTKEVAVSVSKLQEPNSSNVNAISAYSELQKDRENAVSQIQLLEGPQVAQSSSSQQLVSNVMSGLSPKHNQQQQKSQILPIDSQIQPSSSLLQQHIQPQLQQHQQPQQQLSLKSNKQIQKVQTSKALYSSTFYPTELKDFQKQGKNQQQLQEVSSNRAEIGVNKDGMIGVAESQSINSSMHSSASQRRQIIQTINNQQQPAVIQGIKVVGYLALLILLVCNIVVYLVLRNNFDFAQKTFDNMLIFPDIKDRLAGTIVNREFIRISEMEFNGKPPWIIDDLSLQDAIALQFKIMERQANQLSNLIVKKGLDDTEQLYTLNQNLRVNLTFVREDNQNDQHEYTVNYAFILLKHFIERYVIQNDAIMTRRFVQLNYFEFMNQCEFMFDDQRNAAYDTLSQIKNVIIVTMLIIEIVGFLVITTLFPIYQIIQTERESILKLFATFSQEKLNRMTQQLANVLTQELKQFTDDSSGKNQAEKDIKPEQHSTVKTLMLENSKKNQKKKIISNTSELSKFSRAIFICAIITYVLISLYPIINLIISYSFIEEYGFNIDEIATVFKVKGHGQKVYASNYLVIRNLLIGNHITQKNKDDFREIQVENSNLLKELYYLEKNFLKKRSNADIYEKYLLNILKYNVCDEVFINYDHMANALPNKEYFRHRCPEYTKGIMTNGLIVIFQQIINAVDELLDIYQVEGLSIEGYLEKIQLFDKENSIYELHQLWKIVGQSIEICKVLILEMSNLNMEQLQQVQTILFITSIIILCLIFLTGWTKYLQYMSWQLNRTKNMLGLIHIDYILDNSYVLHFINKELKKQRIK